MSAIPSSTSWQDSFLAVLPAIETQAKRQLRRLPAEQRADAVQEAIGHACESYQMLAVQGRLHVAYPSTLASFAIRAMRNGRRVGDRQEASQDVLSPRARRRHGIKTTSLNKESRDGWNDLLIADQRCAVPELAAFRLDFGEWFESFTRRDRQIIAALASGERTGVVAERFGISDGRVSQLRRRYEQDWLGFQGESAAA
jgi:hypothetical protein